MTAHELMLVHDCPMHGGDKQGTFPTDIKATVQYGKNLQALVVALNTVGAVSVKRTHEILSSVFNIPLVKDKAIAQDKDAVSFYHLHKFDKQYDEILKTAYEENPLPEVTAQKRGRKTRIQHGLAITTKREFL